MANHADNDFRAAAKALLDVVAPAIDPQNPLARQQLKLVVDWLDFYRSRLPYNQDRERLELAVQLETARAIASAAPDAAVSALRAAIGAAATVHAGLGPRPVEVRAVTARLEDEISAVVRLSPGFAEPARQNIERVVVRDAKVLLDAQRAWFLPQGIEPEPDAIPPLDVALRIRKPAASPGRPKGPLAPVGGSDRRERGGTIDTPLNEEAGP